MKTPLALIAASVLLTSGCKTDVVNYNNHWRYESVGTSLTRHLLNGYNPHEDGVYRHYQWENKEDINLTLMRHFLNTDPYNPSSYDVDWAPREQPVHSLVPYTWDYMHVESIVFGMIALGASTGTAFIPIPVGSVLGTFEEGGGTEFGQGFRQTFGRKGAVTASFHTNGYGQETVRASWVDMSDD